MKVAARLNGKHAFVTPVEQDTLIDQELAVFRDETLVDPNAFPGDVRQLLVYLHEHLFDESINVSTLLERSGTQGSSIRARFKRNLGKTLQVYLEEKRMLAAMRLLRYEWIDVSRIALEVGYAYPETFSRAFRRCMGCSPSGYRMRVSREASRQEDQARLSSRIVKLDYQVETSSRIVTQ